MHRLLGAHADAADVRARVLSEPQRGMLDRLCAADPTFTVEPWHCVIDTYAPLLRGAPIGAPDRLAATP